METYKIGVFPEATSESTIRHLLSLCPDLTIRPTTDQVEPNVTLPALEVQTRMSKEELTEILSDWKAWDGSIVDTPPSSNGVKEEKGEFDLNAWLSTNIERDDVNPLTARINEFLDSIDGPPPVADLIRSVTLPVTEMILDLVAVHGVEKTQDWLAEQLATQRAAQAVADVRDLLREFGNNGTSEHQKVVIKLLTVLDNTYDTVLSSQSTT